MQRAFERNEPAGVTIRFPGVARMVSAPASRITGRHDSEDENQDTVRSGVSVGRPTPKRRLDAPLIVIGGVISGEELRSAFGLGSTPVPLGPTAATLNDAFGLLYGAAAGLAVGIAVVAFSARIEPKIVTGLFSGLLGYVAVVAPVLIATRPSDVSTSESISTAALAAILVTPAILFGAAVGGAIASRRGRPFTSRRANAPPRIGNGR